MTVSLETGLLLGGGLAMAGGVVSLFSRKVAIPSLVLFLVLGMMVGPDGLAWVPRVHPEWAHGMGTIALLVILFSGGLDTKWGDVKGVGLPAGLLATVGVVITMGCMAVGGVWALKMSWAEGLLMGAILASTDAAAVFGVLRSARIGFKAPIRSLLELESGSNDPMAIFLTMMLIQWLTGDQEVSWQGGVMAWVQAMGVGGLVGLLAGQGMGWFLKRWHGTYDATIPILMAGLIGLGYGISTWCGGSGFLAVYVAGIRLAKEPFAKKQFVTRFFDGLAWAMQWAVFMTLGLMVIPGTLWALTPVGLALTMGLMWVVRPLAVWACLTWFRIPWRMMGMVSWGGLKGAAPIVLATFPYMAGLSNAPLLFHIVFFVVLASVVIQGSSIRQVAIWLGVDRPMVGRANLPLEMDTGHEMAVSLTEIEISYESGWVGQRIAAIGLPKDCLVVMSCRNGKWSLPSAQTPIEGGDLWVMLCKREDLEQVMQQGGMG